MANKSHLLSKSLTESIREEDEILHALELLVDYFKEKRELRNLPKIPVVYFSYRELGVLEVVVKTLKENYKLGFNEIADLLKRDDRTIWSAYKDASTKIKIKFAIEKKGIAIPSTIFSNRKLGPLEILVVHLKDHLRMSFKDIAKMLNRDYRTIWLSYKHGKEKLG